MVSPLVYPQMRTKRCRKPGFDGHRFPAIYPIYSLLESLDVGLCTEAS